MNVELTLRFDERSTIIREVKNEFEKWRAIRASVGGMLA